MALRQEQFAIEQRFEGKFFSGPLPPSEELKAYADISPQFPERIFSMAEKEQSHRHGLEQRRMGAQIWLNKAGQIFGFVLAVLIMGLAGALLFYDKKVEGLISLAAGLGTLIGPFIYRVRRERTVKKETVEASR
ncbi:MAG: DUF2335 domain-containing protein [Verrucomicrobiota bacterium]|nr:DUF2335 domain-containing protein [Verrucomicrobiota bacterium]